VTQPPPSVVLALGTLSVGLMMLGTFVLFAACSRNHHGTTRRAPATSDETGRAE